jgi:transcriptional regulator with XRE-family HTH domain
MSDAPETFGQRLRRLRLARNMVLRDVAGAAGVRESDLSHWEYDRYLPRADRIAALASVLRTTTDYLLTGAETDIAIRVDFASLPVAKPVAPPKPKAPFRIGRGTRVETQHVR